MDQKLNTDAKPEKQHEASATNFIIDDDDRYSRLRLISWWDQDKLASAKVLVVGAGALGNEVLKNLALVGIGKICLIDFDTILLEVLGAQ